ncbi:hypothetical protein PRUB_b0548 [Pseudoalteromonas rubra]|uniref:Uncharacterized protein n=1 Tax=Pseudoalteromonas rubra TaxID=43658 RepID=A0A8T0C289_9GAMM|nr:hypothetical protein PRUB_b0548 [Pseudoalteromonas rubra]
MYVMHSSFQSTDYYARAMPWGFIKNLVSWSSMIQKGTGK